MSHNYHEYSKLVDWQKNIKITLQQLQEISSDNIAIGAAIGAIVNKLYGFRTQMDVLHVKCKHNEDCQVTVQDFACLINSAQELQKQCDDSVGTLNNLCCRVASSCTASK